MGKVVRERVFRLALCYLILGISFIIEGLITPKRCIASATDGAVK
jgi:hypothetical protein